MATSLAVTRLDTGAAFFWASRGWAKNLLEIGSFGSGGKGVTRATLALKPLKHQRHSRHHKM